MRNNPHAVLDPPHAEIARLREQIAELERFASMAAHEVLTPLVMIDAYAVTILDRSEDELHAESLRDLNAVRRAAARSRLLAETLLHYGRSAEPQRVLLDLDLVLRESLTLLAPEIRSRGAEVRLARLPWVLAEETMIGAVFTNLLMNALKYGPREGATISVAARREIAGWRFLVASKGQTIAAEERERIFAPFQRGHGERRARGSGLGLAICREIVERHGGRIGVNGLDGGGNCFSFTLPDETPPGR